MYHYGNMDMFNTSECNKFAKINSNSNNVGIFINPDYSTEFNNLFRYTETELCCCSYLPGICQANI